MDRIPFKTIGFCSATLTLLIVARCLVSIGRVLYYGGNYWLSVIQADPWLYVAVATAAISVISFTMTIMQERLRNEDAYDEDSLDDDEV
jgi:hypothetical protein